MVWFKYLYMLTAIKGLVLVYLPLECSASGPHFTECCNDSNSTRMTTFNTIANQEVESQLLSWKLPS